MRPERILGALLALAGGVLLSVPAIADEPAPDPTNGPVELDDVTLRWGINNESSNRAFAPDTYNFFSAGMVPDPGKGGTTLPKSRWKASAGNTTIQKWNGKRWKRATWKGLRTDSGGKKLGSPTAGTFSNHRFVFGAGTGTVDVAAGTAQVTWDGDVTVLYYSGMSFFTLSDPVLDIAEGRGTLTATLSGYASSVNDPTQWEPVPAAQVTVADLPEVTLEDTGVSAKPAYQGVTVTGVNQVSGGPHFGSFPQSFVDYMNKLGTAPFWLSSGGVTDGYKIPLPLTVAFGATEEEPVEPTPSATPTKKPVKNPIVPPPATVTATVTVTAQPVAPPPAAPVVPPVPTSSAPAIGAIPAATQLVAISQTSAASAEPASETTWIWWLGGGLLLAAALTLLVPVGRPRRP